MNAQLARSISNLSADQRSTIKLLIEEEGGWEGECGGEDSTWGYMIRTAMTLIEAKKDSTWGSMEDCVLEASLNGKKQCTITFKLSGGMYLCNVHKLWADRGFQVSSCVKGGGCDCYAICNCGTPDNEIRLDWQDRRQKCQVVGFSY